jgi:hypothetical protein
MNDVETLKGSWPFIDSSFSFCSLVDPDISSLTSAYNLFTSRIGLGQGVEKGESGLFHPSPSCMLYAYVGFGVH